MEYVLQQASLEKLIALLGFISGITSLYLSLRSNKREDRKTNVQETSAAIDDLDQVRKALMEEIGRLSSGQAELKQENKDLRAEIEVLKAENEDLRAEVKALKAELERLGQLKSNV